MNYQNAELDDILAQAGTSTDMAERTDLYAQALTILAEDAVVVPVFNTKETIITSSNVQGFAQHPDRLLSLARNDELGRVDSKTVGR